MTEPRMRDLFTWLEAHRSSMMEQSGALAEIVTWSRSTTLKNVNATLERIGDRCERLAFELAAALEALHRVHPDPQEETDPRGLRP